MIKLNNIKIQKTIFVLAVYSIMSLLSFFLNSSFATKVHAQAATCSGVDSSLDISFLGAIEEGSNQLSFQISNYPEDFGYFVIMQAIGNNTVISSNGKQSFEVVLDPLVDSVNGTHSIIKTGEPFRPNEPLSLLVIIQDSAERECVINVPVIINRTDSPNEEDLNSGNTDQASNASDGGTNTGNANGVDACIGDTGENNSYCVNCIQQGGIWTAIGCVDTSPIGIITGLIRVSFGVMSGVALVQLIVVGLYFQSGEEAKIEEGKEKLKATFSGLIILIFSVLILRILGINVLDVLPTGSI